MKRFQHCHFGLKVGPRKFFFQNSVLQIYSDGKKALVWENTEAIRSARVTYHKENKIFTSILQLENQIFVAPITDLRSLEFEVNKISIFLVNSIKAQKQLETKVISRIQEAASIFSTRQTQEIVCKKNHLLQT